MLDNLVGRRTAAEVVLRPLEGVAVAEMVAECVGSTAAGPAIVQLAAPAEGIPLLVEELLATANLAEPAKWPAYATPYTAVPHSFADSIRCRLSAIGEPVQAVLQAAAVLGRSFDWHLLLPSPP